MRTRTEASTGTSPAGGRRTTRAALLVLASLQGGCASLFIMFPSTDPMQPGGYEHQLVEVGSRHVEAWSRHLGDPDAEPDLFVIELVGNAQRAEGGTMLPSEAHRRAALETWVVNYPGYGGSEGRAALSAVPPAVSAVYDRVAALARGRPVVAYGNSLGGTSALALAARRPVSGVILRNPAPLGELVLGRFGWWNLWLAAIPVAAQIPPSMDATSNARRSEAPALFLVSEDDELVTRPYQEALYCAYRGPKRAVIMEGRRHNGSLTPEASEAVASFLESFL